MKKEIMVLCLLLISSFKIHAQTTSTDLTSSEMELYRLIMEYRQQKGLPSIPISKSLTYVAKLHAKDLQENFVYGGQCNMHSWSSKGNWKPCCYTSDHSQAACMWNKPRELTSYKGDGFEIAHMHSSSAMPLGALNSWKGSSGHNNVMINVGMWAPQKWKAIGIGIYGKFALVWFGTEEDN